MTEIKQRIIATVPNFNMAVTRGKLVERLLEQDYDHVYVLDDSLSDSSSDLAEKYKAEKRFTFVAGDKNVGKILKETMENIYPDLGVKLKVDIGVGENWGEL